MEALRIYHMKLKNIEGDILENVGMDLIEIVGLDFGKQIAYEAFDEFEVMFTFLSEYDTQRVIKVLEKHGILISYKDITGNVLRAKMDQERSEQVFSVSEYKQMLNRFLMANLTVDIVLDKISEQGIESISDIDKKILEKK